MSKNAPGDETRGIARLLDGRLIDRTSSPYGWLSGEALIEPDGCLVLLAVSYACNRVSARAYWPGERRHPSLRCATPDGRERARTHEPRVKKYGGCLFFVIKPWTVDKIWI